MPDFPPYYEDWPANGWAIPYHKQVTVHCPVNDTMVTADEGIIADLRILWHYGIGTANSCQGGSAYPGNRYIALENPLYTNAATELLAWAFANTVDRQNGAVYDRPGGALRGIFPVGLAEISGELH